MAECFWAPGLVGLPQKRSEEYLPFGGRFGDMKHSPEHCWGYSQPGAQKHSGGVFGALFGPGPWAFCKWLKGSQALGAPTISVGSEFHYWVAIKEVLDTFNFGGCMMRAILFLRLEVLS